MTQQVFRTLGIATGPVEHLVGVWHLEAQAQRAHARHQLGSDAADRVVFTTRPRLKHSPGEPDVLMIEGPFLNIFEGAFPNILGHHAHPPSGIYE